MRVRMLKKAVLAVREAIPESVDLMIC